MSSYWFPGPFEVDVDNPGYGEVAVSRQASAYHDGWRVELRGPQIGAALRALTELAVDDDRTAREIPGLRGLVTVAEARELLPAFQSAVVLAAAGSDRAERVFPQENDEQPADPICVTCGEGSPYTPTKDTTNPWCGEHGHQAFGQYSAFRSWERALEVHQRDIDWWETRSQARKVVAG